MMIRILLHGMLLLWAPHMGQTTSLDELHAKKRLEGVDELDKWLIRSMEETRAGELSALIDQLNAPAFSEREDASALLIETGPQAFSALRNAYQYREAFETLMRIEETVREIYLKHYVYDRNAFLGISQHLVPKENGDDARIRPGYIGILIRNILKGTAAEGVQLKKNDIIIALDGEPLTGSAREGVLAFGESIRTRGPGTRVILTVLRGSEQLEFDVTLGSRPMVHYNVNQGPVFEMLDAARQGFDRFWERHFASVLKDNQAGSAGRK